MRRRLPLGLLLVAACGCESTPPCTVRGAPEVELGTASLSGSDFVAVADGQRLPLTFGLQGGFHVWGNVRARNVCFDTLEVVRRGTMADTGEEVIRLTNRFSLVASKQPGFTDWGELPIGQPTFLCPHAVGAGLLEQRMKFSVEIRDRQGRTASDTRVAVPYCPADTYEEACLKRCAPPLSADGGL